MEIGIGTNATKHAGKVAQRAEELGFDSISFADSPMICGDLFVGMAAAAAMTERIRIGTFVCVPWTRNPVVTASAISSLNAMAPGRIDLRFGTGFSCRRTFGLKAQPLKDFSAHVKAVIALLRGEEVDIEIEGAPRAVKLIHPCVVNIQDPIRIHLAASGPKVQALAAELGTGVIDVANIFADVDSFASMKLAWKAAGRALNDLYLSTGLSVIVRHENESPDSERLRQIGGCYAMSSIHYLADEVMMAGKPLSSALPETTQVAVKQYIDLMERRKNEPGALNLKLHEGHSLFLRPDEAHIVNADLMARKNFIGTAAEIRAKVEQLEKSGVNHLICCITPGFEDAMDDLAKALDLRHRAKGH